MKEATFIVIHGDKNQDSFMKAADLFRGKNLGSVEEITIDYKSNVNLTLSRAKTNIMHLKEALEETNQIVSFVHLKQIRNNNTIKINSTIKPYFDKKTREISNGKKSFILKEFIELTTPFKCETDKNFYITKLIPK